MTSTNHEPLANMGLVHAKCAPKPRAVFQESSVEFFVGNYVKLGFKTVDKSSTEHMWVKVTGLAETPGEELRGTLDNDPAMNVGYECGDQLEFSRSEIEDFLLVPAKIE